MKQVRKSIDGSTQGKRVPVGHRDALKVGANPELENNHSLRWVNDLDNRLHEFLDAGYEFVQKDEISSTGSRTVDNTEAQVDSRVSKVVSYDKLNNRPVSAYLMKIKKEWYEQDQNEKADRIQARKERMVGKQDEPGHYGKINIT